MSRHRSDANRAKQDRRDAQRDKGFWKGRRDDPKNTPEERSFFQGGVRDARQRIQAANDRIRKG